MSQKNRFGLSRNIPRHIAKKIRQEAGFGCVVCGAIPFEYEHIDPTWVEANKHDPDRMTLLCGGCHSKVTLGLLSKETVWKAKKAPKTLEKGYSNVYLDFTEKIPDVKIGETIFVDCDVPLRVAGKPVIESRIRTFENGRKQIYLSGSFYNEQGEEIGCIIDNEWRGLITNHDIFTVKNRITVKSDKKIIFQFSLEPPNLITIEVLNLSYKGNSVFISNSETSTHLVFMGSPAPGSNNVLPGVFFTFDPGRVFGLESIDLDSSLLIKEKEGQPLVFHPSNGQPQVIIPASHSMRTKEQKRGFGK